jgi:hypothetical protein
LNCRIGRIYPSRQLLALINQYHPGRCSLLHHVALTTFRQLYKSPGRRNLLHHVALTRSGHRYNCSSTYVGVSHCNCGREAAGRADPDGSGHKTYVIYPDGSSEPCFGCKSGWSAEHYHMCKEEI